jgi:hypothetical protein
MWRLRLSNGIRFTSDSVALELVVSRAKYAQKSRSDKTLGLDVGGLLLVATLDRRLNVQSNFSSAFLGIDQSMKPVLLWT